MLSGLSPPPKKICRYITSSGFNQLGGLSGCQTLLKIEYAALTCAYFIAFFLSFFFFLFTKTRAHSSIETLHAVFGFSFSAEGLA